MIKQRALTKEEQQLLQSYTNSYFLRELIQAMGFGFFILSCLSYVILFGLWQWLSPSFGIQDPRSHQIFFVILCGGVTGTYFLSIIFHEICQIKQRKNREFSLRIERDIKNNIACEETFYIRRVAEIEEWEDEGAGFLLELEDGRVLCVIGQDLYPYAYDAECETEEEKEQAQTFPSKQIIYTYAPESKIRLDVQGTSDYLSPDTRIKVKKTFFTTDIDDAPADGEFYDQPFQNLIEKFNDNSRI